jgi:hypothetical protein
VLCVSTLNYAFSDALVGQILDPIIPKKFLLDPNNVCFLGIVIYIIWVRSVLMFRVVVYTSPEMSSLMRPYFPSQNLIPM